jgi:hypothetical protein
MSQKSAGAWIKPVVPAAGTVMFAALVGFAAPAAMAAGAEQLTYRVTHAVFGDIGTYSNTVEPRGEATTVKTQSHLNVTLLGANVFHEEAQRVEQWQGNRLVSFRGVTSRKDGSTEVTGEARGNSFVITSPKGTVTAPASVRPANPWSDNFISANMMMRPDNGRVEPVSVSGGAASSVKLNNSTIQARRYDISGETKYSVWLDTRGIPVQFMIEDDTGTVTFTLTHCMSCGITVSEATPRQ